MRTLNADALSDPRVTIVHDDAMAWLDPNVPAATEARPEMPYDVVIVDFPDPNNFSLGKLYTRRFYELLRGAIDEGSAVVVQATSPLYARRSFWCIEKTMREAGFETQPYHATVPSFGEWGYVLAKRAAFDPPRSLDVDGLRYLDDDTLPTLFVFPTDMSRVDVASNHLNDQQLVRYYLGEWD
jgi:spermidine synthase